jgi:hypothetical protein
VIRPLLAISFLVYAPSRSASTLHRTRRQPIRLGKGTTATDGGTQVGGDYTEERRGGCYTCPPALKSQVRSSRIESWRVRGICFGAAGLDNSYCIAPIQQQRRQLETGEREAA